MPVLFDVFSFLPSAWGSQGALIVMELGFSACVVFSYFPLTIRKQRKRTNEEKKWLSVSILCRGAPHSYVKGKGHVDIVT